MRFSAHSSERSVAVLGIAATPMTVESDAVLDELVFEATYSALRQAGVRKQSLGLSVTASLDVYDGRSISSGLTNSASGGYLSESYRIEGDVGQAVIAAAQAVVSGDVDSAVAVGVYNPEFSSSRRRASVMQLSNYSFDPLYGRPIGLTSDNVYGLHANAAIAGKTCTEKWMFEWAAEQITRGSSGSRAIRRPVDVANVAESPLVSGALRELMLPAYAAGAVAVVLGSVTSTARRARNVRAIITGWGSATADSMSSDAWLTDPCASTRRAAKRAYANAEITPIDDIVVAEFSAPTPALWDPTISALQIEGADAVCCPSGGMLSCYPGVANGALRMLEAVEWMEGHRNSRGRAVVQSSDTVSATLVDTSTVFVLEPIL